MRIVVIHTGPAGRDDEDMQRRLKLREIEGTQDHLDFVGKIERSIEAIERGEGVSEEVADRRIDEWLSSLDHR
jgi:hypothetical protein